MGQLFSVLGDEFFNKKVLNLLAEFENVLNIAEVHQVKTMPQFGLRSTGR